jgi:hypothetical protein
MTRRQTLYVRLSMPLTTFPTTILISRMFSLGSQVSQPPFRGPTYDRARFEQRFPRQSSCPSERLDARQDRPAGFTPRVLCLHNYYPLVVGGRVPEAIQGTHSFSPFSYTSLCNSETMGPFRRLNLPKCRALPWLAPAHNRAQSGRAPDARGSRVSA